MATQLFKDGKSAWFEAETVARNIEAGWSVENEEPKLKVAPKPAAKAKAKD